MAGGGEGCDPNAEDYNRQALVLTGTSYSSGIVWRFYDSG